MSDVPEIKIIYENRNLIALNKPAGVLVHGVKGKELGPTLADWLKKEYPETGKVGDDPEQRPGIVHRLDKETSGILVVARSQEYFLYLKSLFQSRKIEKKYLAWVWGEPKDKSGTINLPIGIKPGSVRRSVHSGKMSKEAVTDYKILRCKELSGKKMCLLEIFPKTGRTHQIRVHLASIGCPVVGDAMYGLKNERKKSSAMKLHAFSLVFEIEPGRKISLVADPPEGFDG